MTNVNINGFDIGQNNPNVKLSPPVQGLMVPAIRTASGDFSGRDGGWLASQFYSNREIVVRGWIVGDSCEDAFAIRCELLSALPIRQSLPFIFTTPDGTNYYADVYFTAMNADYQYARIQEFQLTFVAPDPYLYGVDSGSSDPEGWIEQTIEKVIGGGYITPYILPVEWEPSGQPTIVNNPNDVLIYPQIILTGTFTNPQITNETTGEFIKANITTTTGDQLIFDLRQRTITLNGGSVLPSMSGTWWGLVEGDNYISLMTDSAGDDSEGIIRYRIAYTGIGIGC